MSLDDLRRCTHMEIIYCFGAREVITIEAYLALGQLPPGARAVPLMRRDLIARRNRKPRRAS